jgi:hypothetical protein
MQTEPRTTESPTTTTRTPSRQRGLRRSQAEDVAAATPRYVTLGEGSRFEFALASIAMVAIWVAFVAAILAL